MTAEYQREYKRKHPDKVRQWNLTYLERHPETARAAKQRWRDENKEHIAEYNRQYKQRRKERKKHGELD